MKGWFWRMRPRSSFRSGEHVNVPSFRFFVPGEHPNVPSFRFSFRGNIRQNHPSGNHPLSTPEIRDPNSGSKKEQQLMGFGPSIPRISYHRVRKISGAHSLGAEKHWHRPSVERSFRKKVPKVETKFPIFSPKFATKFATNFAPKFSPKSKRFENIGLFSDVSTPQGPRWGDEQRSSC